MRLKQVTLINFKSYKGETKVFIDDGTTMIVGRNGAGKSNFLQAIDFVFGSRHAHLSRSSRPRLINDSGDRASIEVVLHDDDGLFGSGELVIKREFDVQLDRFYVNGSRFQKSEMIVLLEVMGFSRPTPYHANSTIQLKELILSNAIERLNATLNYLGLSISLTVSFIRKLLPNTKEWGTNMSLFDELVKDQNSQEIREEMARHQTFSSLSKMKSALRFKISCIRKESWTNLMEVELNTASLKGQSAQALHSLKKAIASCKTALEKAESEALSEKILLDGYMQGKELIAKNLESLNLSINEIKSQVEIEELNISVDDTVEVSRSVPARIEELENLVRIEQTAVKEISEKLCEQEQNRNDLLLMLNCNEQCSSLHEKTRWIDNTVKKLKKTYDENVETVKMYERRKKAVKNSINECENNIKLLDNEKNAFLNTHKELTSMRLRLGEMQVELHNLNSQEKVILNEMGVLMNSLKSKKTELNCKIGSSTMNGMLSVKLVLDTWVSTDHVFANGCYGTVLDNIECSDALNTALEAAVGNRLFSQIVDTDVIGTAVLREMKSKELSGEVVFLPLNRITPHESPRVSIDGAELFISQLSYSDNIHAAISYLFGRILLCRNLEIATKVAKEYRCVCVTIQGDRVVGGGPMTGGYVDSNAASRTQYQAYHSLQASYAEKNEVLLTKRNEISCLKASIDSVVSFIQREEIKILKGDQNVSQRILIDRLDILKKNEIHWTEQIKTKERDNVLLLKKQKTLEQLFREDLSGSRAQRQLEGFNRTALDLEKELKKRRASSDLMMSEVSLLRTNESCSRRRKDWKVAGVSKCKAALQKLDEYRTKEKLLSSRSRAADQDIARASANLSSHHQKISELKAELQTLKNPELVRGLSEFSLEELQRRLTDLTRELEEVSGGLKLTSRALLLEVEKVNLKDDFCSSKDDLMALFPLQNILHPWVRRHVSKSLEYVCNLFENFFGMIVHDGRGALRIQNSVEDPVLGIDGIDLELVLGGRNRLPLELSTGQKMSATLAIVFALMECQRPCFCVLDEMDQALSKERLEGLSLAICDSVLQGHQFLITSHNTFLVSRGQHHFAVEFKRGGSGIQPVSSTEALSVTESVGVVPRRPSNSLTSSQSTVQSSPRQSPFVHCELS
ncbi:hypothetical protein GE061_009331 [Apolygus lucorum]|uniref:SMC hinge domain-containing protein n=1 Tax=Apolygus lucorum TaxID=248454 RepID=A0A8S9Y1Z7_APOLU|nr:hypothetical protein GE061_009331 [Apolygus lucorum]